MQSKISGSTSAWLTSATVTQTCFAAAGRLAVRSSPSLRNGCLSVSSQVPTVAPNLAALVPAALGDTVSQKKCAWKLFTAGVKLSASHSMTIDWPEIEIDRMLMHFTPGRESHARARAVDDGPVVAPPPEVVVDRVVGDDPSGGNVTVEVASSPPHAAATSAATTTAKASGNRRWRRGPADATKLSTSSRYCLAAVGWWSSRSRRDSAVLVAPDACAALALRSEFARGHGRA